MSSRCALSPVGWRPLLLRSWRACEHPLYPPQHVRSLAAPPSSFVPETVLKSRKRRDELRAAALAARKEERVKAKTRRSGELKRAETYLAGELGGA